MFAGPKADIVKIHPIHNIKIADVQEVSLVRDNQMQVLMVLRKSTVEYHPRGVFMQNPVYPVINLAKLTGVIFDRHSQ